MTSEDIPQEWRRCRPQLAWHQLGKIVLAIFAAAFVAVALASVMVARSDEADHRAAFTSAMGVTDPCLPG
jgi:hypothetical protein